jgi:hypothetical protein
MCKTFRGFIHHRGALVVTLSEQCFLFVSAMTLIVAGAGHQNWILWVVNIGDGHCVSHQ